MKIARLYDKVAQTYNQGQSSHILAKSNAIALELTLKQKDTLSSILSLGIGDGLYLIDYIEKYPQATLHGLDISKNMLEKAKERFNCAITQGDAKYASKLITHSVFELIHAHFIIAYVPFTDVLKECDSLLAPNGIISIVSNTHASFPKLHALLKKFETSRNPFNRFVAQHANETISNIFVPRDAADFSRTLDSCDYQLKDYIVETIPVCLNTEEDVFDFFINGGWFVSGLEHPLISDLLIRRIIKHLISKHITLPYNDTLNVIIGLAEKKTLATH